MRRQSRTFKWFLGIVSALVVATAIVLIFQPGLYRGLREGFPSPVWPAKGTFVEVNDNGRPLPSQLSGSPTKRLAELNYQSGTRQLLVLHRGKIVLDLKTGDSSSSIRFNSYSMVKSLVGALVFKAVSEGRINSFNDPIQRYVGQLKGTKLGKVPVSAFLDMKSGVLFEHKGTKAISVREPKDLQASFANPFGPMARLHMQGLPGVIDNLRFDASGQQGFNYQNVNTVLLSAMLEEAYGVGIQKLLEQKIWKPSGAGNAFWRKFSDDQSVSAYCCLYATTRDWAKAGRFLADNGNNGEPFLTPPLWRKFFGVDLRPEALNKGVYANHARYDILNRKGEELQGRFTYFMGHSGQVMYLMPEKKLIVVRFGDNPQLLHSTLYEIWKSIN